MRWTDLPALIVLGACSLASGDDFNQWRGPQRNGITVGGPPLVIDWGKDGPTRLWESEPIPGMLIDGSGCVSVAGDKAYVYVQWKYKVDIPTRTLSDSALRRLGWTDRQVPDDVLRAVEPARVSPERLALKTPAEIQAWALKWLDARLTEEQRKAFGSFIVGRLKQGPDAIGLAVLAKLATIRNKPFADQAALDKWFAENGVADTDRAAAIKLIPTTVGKSWDTLICLNAANGRTLFKKQFEGGIPNSTYWYGASGTPTVVDGRCYFVGSRNDTYCINAETGEEIWQFNPSAKGRAINHSSPLVVDGKAIVSAGPLVALDSASGSELWRQPKATSRETSPVLWRSGGRSFLLCNNGSAAGTLHCVDLANGEIVWSVPAGGSNTPAIVGDHLVTSLVIGKYAGDATKYGLVAYKLTPEKAEKLWSTETHSAGGESVLIHDGYVYSFGPRVALCIELATGRVAWMEKTTHRGWRSPVLADGRIVTSDGSSVLVIRATPEKYELLGRAKLPIGQYTSPVVVSGRLYLRQQKNVACYDLTRPGTTTAPESPDPPSARP